MIVAVHQGRPPPVCEVLEEPVGDPRRSLCQLAGSRNQLTTSISLAGRIRVHGVTRTLETDEQEVGGEREQDDSPAPSRYFVGKNVWRPSVISWPRPPNVSPPMIEATVASPMDRYPSRGAGR